MHDGAFQNRRFPDALLKNYVWVDERELPELLLSLMAYAKNLNFYNLDGKVSGDWTPLLTNDETILLLLSIPVNQEKMKRGFKQEKSQGVRHTIRETWRYIEGFNEWFIQSSIFSTVQARELVFKVKKIVKENLLPCVSDIISFSKDYKMLKQLRLDKMEPVWCVERDGIQSKETYTNREEKLERLEQIFLILLNLKSLLSRECQRLIEISSSPVHSPAPGLLLSFLSIFQNSQGKLNAFPEKLIDYYYNEILNNKTNNASSDRVHLECQLSKNSLPVEIKKGQKFSAGKDKNLQDMNYEVDVDSVITGARLCALKTRFLQRSPLISPENITQAVTRIKSSDVLGYINEEKPRFSHSLFGYDDGCSGYSTGDNENTGLAISSNLLLLKEGQRRICLSFDVLDKRYESAFEIPQITNVFRNLERLATKDNSEKELLSELTSLTHHYLAVFSYLLSKNENLNQLSTVLVQSLQSFCTLERLHSDKLALSQQLYQHLLLFTLLNIDTRNSFSGFYHLVFSRHLFNLYPLDCDNSNKIIVKAQQLFGQSKAYEQQLKRIKIQIRHSPDSLMSNYFANAFRVELTAEQGWYHVPAYCVSLDKAGNRFSIAFDLKQGMPPIIKFDKDIHGGVHSTVAPILKILINPDAAVYPYSYLRILELSKVNLKVKVASCKKLIIQSDQGMLDRAKPFYPFGPMPENGASLYIGGFEYASKNISMIRVNIKWKNLPENYGGFRDYYSEYDYQPENDDFKVVLSVSSGGRWVPSNQLKRQTCSLFESISGSDILLSGKQFNIELNSEFAKLSEQVSEQAYSDLSNLQNGHLKLQLSTGTAAFGHKTFPRVMGQVLTKNIRRRKPLLLPEEPYTPEIEAVSVDYIAAETIKLDKPLNEILGRVNKNSDNDFIVRAACSYLYHVTSMGLAHNVRKAASAGISFFPDYSEDGNLYIGFDKSDDVTSLSLYFKLKMDATHSIINHERKINWYYFSANGWLELNHYLISNDSTNGLLHSGIVNLELPVDISRHIGLVPSDKYWLKISTSEELSSYSSVQGICFDAISLVTCTGSGKISDGIDKRSSDWKPLKTIAEVQSFKQTQAAFDSVNAECKKQSFIRIYERLRHKNRAVTTWDYERLVLEHFPSVFMVKCFSAMSSSNFNYLSTSRFKPSPGHVMLVVLPNVSLKNSIHKQGYYANSVLLQEIYDYIKMRCAPYVKLEVRNPVYKSVQVRCAVRFNKTLNTGTLVSKLEQAISNYISPWVEEGYGVKFGWVMRKNDIESHLLELPFVSEISKLSMIKITQISDGPDRYMLKDSAKQKQSTLENTGRFSSEDLCSDIPWSLAIPASYHHIEVLDDNEVYSSEPEPVGINSLEVGSNFIIKEGKFDALS